MIFTAELAMNTVVRTTIIGLLVAMGPTVAESEDGSAIEQLQQANPGFLVRGEVDRPSHDYREGDNMVVKAVSEIDAYVYVVYQQADGQTFQIFPNSRQRDNRLKARQEV